MSNEAQPQEQAGLMARASVMYVNILETPKLANTLIVAIVIVAIGALFILGWIVLVGTAPHVFAQDQIQITAGQ